MESRKTAPMNLFTEKKWRCRCREWTCRHSKARKDKGETKYKWTKQQ